uniref:C3H1-type domain-containing protein n=1 Tax=Panagrellus redivivus TaxID=6233 RepID=A0A7E4URH0_PANRE
MSAYNENAPEFKPCRTWGWCKQDCNCRFYVNETNSSSEHDDVVSEYAWQTDDISSDYHSESDEVNSVYAWEADKVHSDISSRADDICSVYAWEADGNSVEVESDLDEVESVYSLETDFSSSFVSLYDPDPFEKVRSRFPCDFQPKENSCRRGCCKGQECRWDHMPLYYYPNAVKPPTEGETPFGFRIRISNIQRVNSNEHVAHGTFVKLDDETYEYSCIFGNNVTITFDGDDIREVLHGGTTYRSFESLPPKVANIMCGARSDLNNV